MFIIGFVFSLLAQVTSPQSNASFTFLFLTIVLILLIKLIEEWRYYRSYNAPLASAIFVMIPSLIAIFGSFVADIVTLDFIVILEQRLVEITLNLDFIGIGSFLLLLNIFSLILCAPFFIILGVLIRRYYSGRYPNIFIFRKRFPSETLILYSSSVTTVLLMFWFTQRVVEISTLIFICLNIFLFVQYYVLHFTIIPFRRIKRSSPSRRQPTIQRQTVQRPRVSPSQAQTRTVRPVRTRSSTIQVAPPVSIPERTTRKISPALIASLTPAGQNISLDDFRCIFCYEFPTESNKQVVICPHCRHPSHANEFNKWFSVANICSRCNKPIKNVSLIRISGSNYKKIIQIFRKKK